MLLHVTATFAPLVGPDCVGNRIANAVRRDQLARLPPDKICFALGLVGLFRGVPIILCSLGGGGVADAIDRKKLMIVTQTVMLASAGLLTANTLAGVESVWPIYILSRQQ